MATRTRKTTERVVFIEYHDGRPFSIMTTDRDDASYGDTYDVDWCKRDRQFYYHLSGCGPLEPIKVYPTREGEVVYWAAEGITVVEQPGGSGKFRRLARARYRREFERALVDGGGWSDLFCQGETVWCDACDDHLSCEDTDSPCGHVWWCDETGWWSTPGGRCPWDCDACRGDGRETRPEPPMIAVARGYGLAAIPVASVTRRILHDHGLTPETLGERMGWVCDERVEAVRMALRGEVDERITPRDLAFVARKLGLSSDAGRDLVRAFGFRGGEIKESQEL